MVSCRSPGKRVPVWRLRNRLGATSKQGVNGIQEVSGSHTEDVRLKIDNVFDVYEMLERIIEDRYVGNLRRLNETGPRSIPREDLHSEGQPTLLQTQSLRDNFE